MGAWEGCGGPGGAGVSQGFAAVQGEQSTCEARAPSAHDGAQPGWPYQPCRCPVSLRSHPPPVPDTESLLPGEDFTSPSLSRPWPVGTGCLASPPALPTLGRYPPPCPALSPQGCCHRLPVLSELPVTTEPPPSHPVAGDTASPVPPRQAEPRSTSPLLGRTQGQCPAHPPQSSSRPAHPRCCQGAPSGSPRPMQPTGHPTARPGATAQPSATLASPPCSAQHPPLHPPRPRGPCLQPGAARAAPPASQHPAPTEQHGGCW